MVQVAFAIKWSTAKLLKTTSANEDVYVFGTAMEVEHGPLDEHFPKIKQVVKSTFMIMSGSVGGSSRRAQLQPSVDPRTRHPVAHAPVSLLLDVGMVCLYRIHYSMGRTLSTIHPFDPQTGSHTGPPKKSWHPCMNRHTPSPRVSCVLSFNFLLGNTFIKASKGLRG